MSKFRVEVDRITCQGFGACVELCPQFFQLSDIDGKISIKGAEKIKEEDNVTREILETDDLGCIRQSAENCPFNAIHIVDTKTGEKLI